MPLFMQVDADKFAKINLARLNLGVPVILCAPGPSLQPLTPQPGVMIAALTKAYPTVRPDIWFGMDEPGCYDRRVWSEPFIKIGNSIYPDRAVNGKKVAMNPLTFLAQNKKSKDVLDIFRERGSDKLFTWYAHTLGVACDILVWMGARKIYLDGFDLRHIDGKDYCDGARKVLTKALRDRNQLLFDQQVLFLKAFHAYGRPNGVEVISSTPGSPLNEFMPFVSRDDALKEAAAAVPEPGIIYHCREINPTSGETIAQVHPFSASGLKAAIAEAKARAERQVDAVRRLDAEQAKIASAAVPAKRGGIQTRESPLESEPRDCKAAQEPDTPQQFAKVWADIKWPIIEQATPYRQVVPVPKVEKHKVGFFFPSASMLAHAVNYKTLFDAMGEHESGVEPVTYALGKSNGAWDSAFPGTRYITGPNRLESMLECRKQSRADELSAMVFVSSPQFMAFLSTIGVAPKSIWLAYKWHGLELPYLDGYIDGCHQFRKSVLIDGRTWPCVYTAMPEMFDAAATTSAGRIRRSIDAPTVFGAFARDQKFTKEFAESVAQILDLSPGSRFVYAARNQLDWLESIVGTDRCKFVGWVYTRLWAQVIDVYLDTFPFMGGHTVFESMAASKPVVWMESPSYADEQTVAEIFDADRWRGYYTADPVARSKEEYIAKAAEYARRPDMQNFDGIAGRRFLDDYLRDTKRMATEYGAELLRIINA
jgi:hypothetical protein